MEKYSLILLSRKIYNKWCFDLARIINEDIKLSNSIITNVIVKNKPICFINDLDDTEIGNQDRTKIKTLYRNVTQIERETGRQETYMGFPFLAGHPIANRYIRGPLILFPISIEHKREGKTSGWFITSSKAKKPTVKESFNRSNSKSIWSNFSETLNEEIEEMIEQLILDSDYSKNAGRSKRESDVVIGIEMLFFKRLNAILESNKLPIQITDANELKTTQALNPISSTDQNEMERQKLHLLNYKVLGNFPQGDTSLYNDYGELINVVKGGEGNLGIIDNLLELPHKDDSVWNEGQGDEHMDVDLDDVPPNHLRLVLESDPRRHRN